MSYCLLWIETLLACLLFAAMLITVGLRSKTRTARALCAVVALLPLIPLAIPLSVILLFAGASRYASGVGLSGFVWAIAPLACYLAGAIPIRIIAGRRDVAGARRSFSWPLGRIAAAWLVVVSLIAMTLWNLDLRAQMEIQALRAEAGAIALSVAPPQVPDSANAAWVYEEVDKQFKAATTPADKDIDYSDLDIRSGQMTDYLQRQHQTLETLRRAADMPQCRLSYDYGQLGFDVIVPKVTPFHERAMLLTLAARAAAVNGDPVLALSDCRRIYAVGQHAASLPMLMTGLFRLSIDAKASKIVAQVLPGVTTRAQMEHLTAPETGGLSRSFARSLRGDEAYGLARFCDLGSGTGFAAQSIARTGGTIMWLTWLQDDIGIYRRYMQRNRDIARQPYYQTTSEREQIEEELQPGKRRGVMAIVLMPSLLKAMRSLTEAEALRSSVVVACAATRYRLDRGDYPATAALLVPGYMESIPVDPFDGQPLRLQRMPEGQLVIYSVGADGKDNGGDVESKDDKHKPADVGLILKMPSVK